ncbi:MAG: DUF2249 domain-containing protein [Actinomycetota bacterium]|nr:DUF2249 domain-containing protein [Actinomycetota bacterium]
MPELELDVRPLRKPDRHPAVFQAYDALTAGESLVLISNHDPRHLHDEFDIEYPGSHGWDYLAAGPEAWRIRIRKLAAALPRILCDAAAVAAGGDPGAAGAVWKLPVRQRDLDANIIRLPPGAGIEAHIGPGLDVLVIVLAGSGHLTTERGTLELDPGALVWLPRRSRRQFAAGPDGLGYLTVHQRRQSLVLAAGAREAAEP